MTAVHVVGYFAMGFLTFIAMRDMIASERGMGAVFIGFCAFFLWPIVHVVNFVASIVTGELRG